MNGQITAVVRGYELARAEFRVSVTQREPGTACVDLNGSANVTVYTGACCVHAYMTPDQMDAWAELLRQAAHAARVVSVSQISAADACAQLAAMADEQRRAEVEA